MQTTGADPAMAVATSKIFVNSGYTDHVIDQNDIAVVRRATAAPAIAQHYLIDTSASLVGKVYNVAGYSGRRRGDNRNDYKFGDSAFDGFFTDVDPVDGAFWDEPYLPFAQYSRSLVADFDNGLAANDMSCNLGGYFSAPAAQFCDLGRGFTDVGVAGGNSGGPQFVNGKVASVTSHGFSFGRGFGDVDGALNSTFGEGNGFVSTALHRNFILSSMVPEPGSWALMIAGFGLVGASMRCQRCVAATA